jgi:hypothetical protein
MIIRRISIGSDLLNAMHFQVGSTALRSTATISDIKRLDDGSHDIYIMRDIEDIENESSKKETVLWKNIGPFVATSVEYNIEF